MASYEEYLKDLKKAQTQPGFKHKTFSVSTSAGNLNIDLYGPSSFLENMPRLIKTVATSSYNMTMFSAFARAKKPLSIIHIEDRSLLGAGALREDLPWYKFLSTRSVLQLAMYFNVSGFISPIYLECRQKSKEGNTIKKSQKYDAIKYTLTHEFFHLWQHIEPQNIPRKGSFPRNMSTPKLQAEVWATRYTNRLRYRETKCIRYLYGRRKFVVDSISNY